MKTVEIPSWNNPFVVTVNNKKYTYPGGTTQSVPDEVAEVIENVINNQPKSSPYTKFATEEYVDNTLLVDENDEIPTMSGGGTVASQTGVPPTPTIPTTEG